MENRKMMGDSSFKARYREANNGHKDEVYVTAGF